MTPDFTKEAEELHLILFKTPKSEYPQAVAPLREAEVCDINDSFVRIYKAGITASADYLDAHTWPWQKEIVDAIRNLAKSEGT